MLATALYIAFVGTFVGIALVGHVLLLTAVLPPRRKARIQR